jgi:hypothetical protein
MNDKLTRKTWLKKNGFVIETQDGTERVQDPFNSYAYFAETDPYRKECFVEFPYYNEIKGNLHSPGPVLIYTVRGGGKSALRCQISEEWDDTLNTDKNRILAVVYNEFDSLLRQVDYIPENVRLRHHVSEIVGLILSRLLSLAIEGKSNLSLRHLESSQKRLLRWYIQHYAKSLHYDEINSSLGRLGGMRYFVTSDNLLRIFRNLSRALPAAEHPVNAVVEVLESSPLREANPSNVSNVDLMSDLIEICQGVGIHGICVLIDDLDTADLIGEGDFRAAFNIIRPLCSTHGLHIRKIKNMFLKVFVPEEIYSVSRGVFRFELGERHIEWRIPDVGESPLHRVLRNRLQVYSRDSSYRLGTYQSLSPLVREDLSKKIDALFFKAAETPRELIVLGDAMLSNHFRYPTTESLLTAEDWEAAKKALKQYRESYGRVYGNLLEKDLQAKLVKAEELLRDYQSQAGQFDGSILPDDLARKIEYQKRKIEELEKEIRESQEGRERDE